MSRRRYRLTAKGRRWLDNAVVTVAGIALAVTWGWLIAAWFRLI